jgi:hypothetical protein
MGLVLQDRSHAACLAGSSPTKRAGVAEKNDFSAHSAPLRELFPYPAWEKFVAILGVFVNHPHDRVLTRGSGCGISRSLSCWFVSDKTAGGAVKSVFSATPALSA